MASKFFTRSSCSRIQRDQTAIDCGQEKPPCPRSVPPSSGAPAGKVAIASLLAHFGVIRPAASSRQGIQRNQTPQRRRNVERALEVERRRFESSCLAIWRGVSIPSAK